MYKFQSKQIGVTDFGMPLGMKLDPNNRWVKKAETIPWDEIELRYAELFKNRKGNVAKPLRLALGSVLIQTEREISDEETALEIQETPCLQYFCGMMSVLDNTAVAVSASIGLNFPQRWAFTIIKTGPNGQRLQGAVFNINSGSTPYDSCTTDYNGVATFTLPAGNYSLRESTPPMFYQSNSDTIPITVGPDNPNTITVVDQPFIGAARIVKTDAVSGVPLPGAVLGIYSDGTKVCELTTGAGGTATSDALPVGDYYALETGTPDGYLFNTNRFDMTVVDGEAATIAVTDTPIPDHHSRRGLRREPGQDPEGRACHGVRMRSSHG